MKRFFISLTTFALVLAPFTAIRAAPSYGDLVKASGSSVYYYGPDGKRYVFPTEKTYFSWYADFSSVRTITDAELSAIPIGGNVTYRPGVRMLKVTTDPRTYAVDANGTLRWVETETVASALYGSNWAQKVDDLPDPFFVNYRLGTSLISSTDYSASSRTTSATTIAVDRGLITTTPTPTPEPTPTPSPTPTSTHTGTLSTSKTNVAPSEMIDLFAVANPSSIYTLRIYFDGKLEKECTGSPCGFSLQVPSAKSEYEALAEFHWMTGEKATSSVRIAVEQGAYAGLSLDLTYPEVRPGGNVEIITMSDSSFIAYTIEILIDGNKVKSCGDVQDCRYLGPETGALGTTRQVYAVFTDRNGATQTTQIKTYKIVSNPRPNVTIELDRNQALVGQSVDATVRASDDDGLLTTEVWWNGALVKACTTNTCTARVGPFEQSGETYVLGRSVDALNMVGWATSTLQVAP